MAVNKVVYNSRTLIDLTADTVSKDTLKKGFTAHQADGTMITTDSKGQKLVKKFSNNMLNMEAVLTDASSKELARLTKVFSADGKDISSTVVYGE